MYKCIDREKERSIERERAKAIIIILCSRRLCINYLRTHKYVEYGSMVYKCVGGLYVSMT